MLEIDSKIGNKLTTKREFATKHTHHIQVFVCKWLAGRESRLI